MKTDIHVEDSRLAQIRVGFLPLTDCAPIAVACKLGLDRMYGLALQPLRQPSWTALRDRLLAGQLDAAHALYGLACGVQLGLGGPQCDMALLMTLNRNGQGISLSPSLAAQWRDGAGLAEIARRLGRPLRLAHTFPTGTHAMWLHYWLAAQDVHPLRDASCVVIPPPQMAAAMLTGALDGYCAGQPWHAVTEEQGCASLVADSAAIWPDHPEKALICRADLAERQPQLASALIETLLLACHWLDQPDNQEQAAAWLAEDAWLGLPAETILRHWRAHPLQAAPLRFFDDGRVNPPASADVLWFLGQYRRWGIWDGAGDADIARALCRTGLYRQAAARCGVACPEAGGAAAVLMDGQRWPPPDGMLPKTGADSAAVR
ncbi:CmpA/NrtA family ABC transporter substrate-binding protein [Chromobacterium violaceum]|uniref:CmpA/NrtA family ABC transporter substrate-binding protein n=1 Tax=Chromobacterium violaceum TaxID=536 RepID=UPI0035A70ED3